MPWILEKKKEIFQIEKKWKLKCTVGVPNQSTKSTKVREYEGTRLQITLLKCM